jgi:hypothetical protein
MEKTAIWPGSARRARQVGIARWTLRAVLLGIESLLSLSTCYLLLLLAGAALGRRRSLPAAAANPRLRFAILVPAHNEEEGIGATLDSLRRLEYPADRFDIVVIADNCRDRTAARARAAGALVYERHDPERRGKGHALAYGLDRLRAEGDGIDAVAVVDADCRVSANLLTALEARLRLGAAAAQADVVVANPDASWSSALRYAGFALMSTVRRLGKDRLGLSCGLHGTGMAFSAATLDRVPWQAVSLIEDSEQHLRLVMAGGRVAFAPEAWVRTAMPTSLRQAQQQQMRYEGGKRELVQNWTPRLVREGIRRRDLAWLHAGLEPLVPPQALLLAANLALAVVTAMLRSRVGLITAVANLLGQGGYVLGGLLLVRAPATVYRALAFAPVLVVWKLGLHGRLLLGRGARDWVRGPREVPPVPHHATPDAQLRDVAAD